MAKRKKRTRNSPFTPRSVKRRGAKAISMYQVNPRKPTKYRGFRTMIKRTAKGKSLYRFDGFNGAIGIKGTFEYVKSLSRSGNIHTGLLKQVGGKKQIAVDFWRGMGKKDKAFDSHIYKR